MKRVMDLIGSPLGLLALGALVLILVFCAPPPAIREEVLFQSFQSPIETPTQPPSPLLATPTPPGPSPTPTRRPIPTIPPTVTRAPKPTLTPSPIPTATPIPTPLSLAPSAFYALWAESFAEGQGSVLWLADPGDIGSRQEVLRFERDAIAEAALSPDGRKLALVTVFWKTRTLWVANVDGTDLQQLDQAAALGGLFWSRDSRSLVYGIGWREEVMMPSYKTGTPVPVPVWRGAIELLDVATGEKRRLLEPELDTHLSVLGWSADGRELYYTLSVRGEMGYEYDIWAVGQGGQDAHKIVSLGDLPSSPILSPDGSKFLIGTSEGLAWISADGRDQQVITQTGRGFTAIWAPDGRDLVVSRWEPDRSGMVVRGIDVYSRSVQDLGVIEPVGDWRLLALSPDRRWLAAYHYYSGLHWIHLSTGMTVSVPSQDQRLIFVAWVPRMPAGQEKGGTR